MIIPLPNVTQVFFRDYLSNTHTLTHSTCRPCWVTPPHRSPWSPVVQVTHSGSSSACSGLMRHTSRSSILSITSTVKPAVRQRTKVHIRKRKNGCDIFKENNLNMIWRQFAQTLTPIPSTSCVFCLFLFTIQVRRTLNKRKFLIFERRKRFPNNCNEATEAHDLSNKLKQVHFTVTFLASSNQRIVMFDSGLYH